MIRTIYGAVLAGVFLATFPSAAADAPISQPYTPGPRVGDYADPERLEIRGAKTFTPEAIKKILFWHWDVTYAAHPSEPIFDYTEVLRKKVRLGYRSKGFPDAEVSADVDKKTRRLVLSIKEGQQFDAGDVRIVGAKKLPVERLKKRLTEPYLLRDAVAVSFEQADGKKNTKWLDRDGKELKPHEAVWRRDRPAPFHCQADEKFDDGSSPYKIDVSKQWPQRQIRRALVDLGYYFTEFEARVIPNRNSGKADLEIRILDEGPVAVIGDVRVAGNKVSSDKAIAKYLGIRPGQVLDRDEYVRISRRLWGSGRFVKFQILPERPAAPTDPLNLCINVTEYADAPPIGKAFSPEEQILLKCRDWLADANRWPGDMVVTFKAPGGLQLEELELVLSPTRGIVGAGGSRGVKDFDVAAVAAPGRVGFYSAAQSKKLESKAPEGQVVADFAFETAEEPDDSERPQRFQFRFGLWLQSKKADDGPPFRLSMQLQPCAFVALAHDRGAQCEIGDGVLTVTKADLVWRIDTESGALIELLAYSEDDPAKEGTPPMRLTFRKDAFAERVGQIEAAAGDFGNEFDSTFPFSSLAAFACKEALTWKWLELGADQKRALRLASLAADQRVFEPLRKLALEVVKGDADEKESFSIPFTPGELDQLHDFTSTTFWAHSAVTAGDRIFPRDTWPWTVWRESWFYVAGGPYTHHVNEELGRLHTSEANGPLCHLTVALLLERLSGEAATAFANRGLQKLSVEDFRNDCRVLLSDDCILGRCAVRFAEALRKMDEQDVKAIEAELDDEEAKLFRRAVRILQKQPAKPIEKVLPELLDALWKNGLGDWVRETLEELRERCKQKLKPPVPQVTSR